MSMTIFAKSHFDKTTLEKEASESFCTNQQILPSKVYSAMLWCFEKMIYREFTDHIEKISLFIYKQPERESSFKIPIEKSAFLTSSSQCRSAEAVSLIEFNPKC